MASSSLSVRAGAAHTLARWVVLGGASVLVACGGSDGAGDASGGEQGWVPSGGAASFGGTVGSGGAAPLGGAAVSGGIGGSTGGESWSAGGALGGGTAAGGGGGPSGGGGAATGGQPSLGGLGGGVGLGGSSTGGAAAGGAGLGGAGAGALGGVAPAGGNGAVSGAAGHAGALMGGAGGLGDGGGAGAGGGAAGATAAAGAGGAGNGDCPHEGHITYTLSRSPAPTDEEQAAYDLIVEAMDHALRYYNCYTDITKELSVAYVPSVQTADGNINGSIRFGATSTMQFVTAAHEIAHTVGVGYYSFDELTVDGIWVGPIATAELRAITGDPTAELHGDSMHFWPYGLNFETEYESEADLINHCRLVVAIRADMGF